MRHRESSKLFITECVQNEHNFDNILRRKCLRNEAIKSTVLYLVYALRIIIGLQRLKCIKQKNSHIIYYIA